MGSTIFTSLDLQLGYWQVELTEASRPLTAFTMGPLGFYECVLMPFALTNAPATFQHLMESCLGEMHLKWCIIYLDYIIVFSKMPEEHIRRFRGVFGKLSAAGLRLKPSKCKFFKSQIAYLGHIVSKDGIETEKKKDNCHSGMANSKNSHRGTYLFGFYKLLSEIHTKICPDCMTYQSVSVWREC